MDDHDIDVNKIASYLPAPWSLDDAFYAIERAGYELRRVGARCAFCRGGEAQERLELARELLNRAVAENAGFEAVYAAGQEYDYWVKKAETEC